MPRRSFVAALFGAAGDTETPEGRSCASSPCAQKCVCSLATLVMAADAVGARDREGAAWRNIG